MSQPPAHWTAVALSSTITRRPTRIVFDGFPFVLFRTGTGVAALADRCPHRFAALSDGKLTSNDIECPYHGWRFNAEGRCTAIPGLTGDLPHYRVRTLTVAERDGAVFVSTGKPDDPPYTHPLSGKPATLRLVTSSAQSTLADTAENILDATHTHFTHKGLLRGLSAKRSRVRVDVTGGPGWVEACYTGEDKQEGLISKLLEGARTKTIGRFRFPGIAELEYFGPDGLVLATTFHLRQATPETVEGIGWLAGPGSGPLAGLKALAFKPLFGIALQQDRRVLKSASENAHLPPVAKPIIGPLDFLRRDIESILAGDLPSAAAKPRTHDIEL